MLSYLAFSRRESRPEHCMVKSLPTWLLAAFLGAGPAHAADLYSGEVMVTAQGSEERAQAVPAALIEVLQKLSGRRELPIGPALDTALLSANRIMVSFYYRERERTAPDGSVSEELWLVARFLPAAVDRIIRELELPRWRQERAPVTIWVVVDDGLGRRLQPVEYGYAWEAMADIAALRGLPVTWPDRGDGIAGGTGPETGQEPAGGATRDQPPQTAPGPGPGEEADRQLDLQLLWGGFTEHLVDPEAAPGGVVVIAARREGPEWNIRWNYSDGAASTGWRSRDRDLVLGLTQGVHRLADFVASRHSIAPDAQGEWRFDLQVSGIAGAGDYERCLAYLEGLSLVNRVDVEQAGAGAVSFRLELNAMPGYLAETIARDRVLEPGLSAHEYRLLP
jgi:hypothetical protein